jgi:hypothetical protein
MTKSSKGARYAAATARLWEGGGPKGWREEVCALADETPALAAGAVVAYAQLMAEVARGLPPKMIDTAWQELVAAVTATDGAWS